MKTSNKIVTSILALFMLLPGFVKFATQIEKAELTFPSSTFFMGHSGLIITGLLLFSLFLFWKKIPKTTVNKLFYIGNLLVIPIMSIAFYVHVHPDVPANILPMDVYFPITLITLAIMNIYLSRIKNQN